MKAELSKRFGELKKICDSRRWTLSLAESCTGGLASAALCSEAGVSSFYVGGIVSYARAVKAGTLGVSWALLKTHGDVSLPVALAMARGARKALQSNWSVSITGIAGPSGGSPEKPVGYVCFAVVGPGFEKAVQQQFRVAAKKKSKVTARQDIQRQATLFAFDLLLSAMR